MKVNPSRHLGKKPQLLASAMQLYLGDFFSRTFFDRKFIGQGTCPCPYPGPNVRPRGDKALIKGILKPTTVSVNDAGGHHAASVIWGTRKGLSFPPFGYLSSRKLTFTTWQKRENHHRLKSAGDCRGNLVTSQGGVFLPWFAPPGLVSWPKTYCVALWVPSLDPWSKSDQLTPWLFAVYIYIYGGW